VLEVQFLNGLKAILISDFCYLDSLSK